MCVCARVCQLYPPKTNVEVRCGLAGHVHNCILVLRFVCVCQVIIALNLSKIPWWALLLLLFGVCARWCTCVCVNIILFVPV